MDISKLALRDPPEKRETQASSSSLPKGDCWASSLLIWFRSFFSFFFSLKVKFFSHIYIFLYILPTLFSFLGKQWYHQGFVASVLQLRLKAVCLPLPTKSHSPLIKFCKVKYISIVKLIFLSFYDKPLEEWIYQWENAKWKGA